MKADINKISTLALVILIFLFGFTAFGQAAKHDVTSQELDLEAETEEDEKLNISEVIIHHVLDDHVWHFADAFVVPLPVIVYSQEKGLDIFSSGNFYDEHHNLREYNGYVLEHGEIHLADGGHVFDMSITKNVAMLFINATLLSRAYLPDHKL